MPATTPSDTNKKLKWEKDRPMNDKSKWESWALMSGLEFLKHDGQWGNDEPPRRYANPEAALMDARNQRSRRSNVQVVKVHLRLEVVGKAWIHVEVGGEGATGAHED